MNAQQLETSEQQIAKYKKTKECIQKVRGKTKDLFLFELLVVDRWAKDPEMNEIEGAELEPDLVRQ